MVAKFIGCVSPKYATIKANVLTSDEIPDLSEDFHMLNRLTTNTN